MLEFLPAIGSLLAYGSMGTVSKKGIWDVGRHKAIVYSYLFLVALLLAGALVIGLGISFPMSLAPLYAIQIAIGALGAIAEYKAMSMGRASVIVPIGRISSVIVLLLSILVLAEAPGALQVIGSLMILLAALVIARDEGGRFSLEPWMPYLALSIICRAYYYTSIKSFVAALGPYQASLFLEIGIAAFIIGFHAIRGKELALPKQRRDMLLPLSAGALLFSGSILYSTSVSWIGAGLTSAIYSGTPIVNTILAYLFLGEKLDMAKYAAIALMVLGLAMIFA
ncbi:MAG: DMT family transporter [Candidatus Micrarchaeota archaeon]